MMIVVDGVLWDITVLRVQLIQYRVLTVHIWRIDKPLSVSNVLLVDTVSLDSLRIPVQPASSVSTVSLHTTLKLSVCLHNTLVHVRDIGHLVQLLLIYNAIIGHLLFLGVQYFWVPDVENNNNQHNCTVVTIFKIMHVFLF